jgi:hypothetical protein
MTVTMMFTNFWGVMECGLADRYQQKSLKSNKQMVGPDLRAERISIIQTVLLLKMMMMMMLTYGFY